MKIGILGGSFDPIHHGHLVIATRAAEALELDRVLFIPASLSPLKSANETSPTIHRWAMLKLALRGHQRFAACDIEIRRGGVSYTVDTLRALRRRTRAELHLILGADARHLLHRWRDADEVKRLATIVTMARPGHRLRARMPKEYIVDSPLMEVSGSEIRERTRKGLSIRYLVPDDVERYIRRKGLYR